MRQAIASSPQSMISSYQAAATHGDRVRTEVVLGERRALTTEMEQGPLGDEGVPSPNPTLWLTYLPLEIFIKQIVINFTLPHFLHLRAFRKPLYAMLLADFQTHSGEIQGRVNDSVFEGLSLR